MAGKISINMSEIYEIKNIKNKIKIACNIV